MVQSLKVPYLYSEVCSNNMARNMNITIHGLTEEQVRDTLKNHKPTELEFVEHGVATNHGDYLVINLKILNIEYTLFSKHNKYADWDISEAIDWVQVVVDCKRKSMMTRRAPSKEVVQ
jgi:hypothetical protein